MAAAAAAINNPEELDEKRRERNRIIAQKKQERRQICDALDKEIYTLENTCLVTGEPCDLKEIGSNAHRRETYYSCNHCGKDVMNGGGKRTRRKSHRRKKRSRRKQKTRRKRRKRRSRKKR